MVSKTLNPKTQSTYSAYISQKTLLTIYVTPLCINLGHPKPSDTLFLLTKNQVFGGENPCFSWFLCINPPVDLLFPRFLLVFFSYSNAPTELRFAALPRKKDEEEDSDEDDSSGLVDKNKED